MSDRKCPHDAWFEHIKILESATDERRRIRHIDMEIRCLGSYHDGYFTIKYTNLLGYKINCKISGNEISGHSDWYIDELILLDNGKIRHEILLADGTTIEITANDIQYEWEDM